MRIAVVGCGAIGSLYAARLSLVDEIEVWAYDRDAEHIAAINLHGLRISGLEDAVGRPRGTTAASELPECDFGLVATKMVHADAAVSAAAHALRGGAVCSLQNGLGGEEIIARYVPAVIRGTVFPAAHIVNPGHVAVEHMGETWIGPFEPSPASMDRVELLARTLRRAKMPTSAMTDARGAQWTKLIFNAAANPVGALTRLKHGRACEIDEVRQLMRELMAEGEAVAAALGISLESSPAEMLNHTATAAYDHRASMLQDIEAGRATEIDALCGAIADLGSELGVPTLRSQAMRALVRAVEEAGYR